ncbi:MAG: Hydroxymethylpyrimidine ABC transporter, substrate-binding component [Candidatus Carbobacillus altaicus]|uniref:Hydroxymethylpyrimidine ABC transporter, substrate-binding component n=1 Tax=Candidatus Carbonibacillus altaicus TaxID=2163959 RepID=A0A2R6XYU1_9BACL|nr:MAG: Hydroxymethylpyrimidine ABC transporter, substrate-binding component [Candidatus Carbobacillus altaicus]
MKRKIEKTAGLNMLLVVLGLFLLLSGCGEKNLPGGASTADDARASRSKEKETKLTVMLDWYPNTNHTGLYVALKRGYFAAEGLSVDIVQPGESGVPQAVAAGRADIGFSFQEEVTFARASGLPVVSIAAPLYHNTSAFAALASSGIKTVEDFAGKTYGSWGSPTEEAVLKALLKQYGLPDNSVQIITLGQSDFFATIGRDVDFEWIFYGWDGIEAERRGIELNTIFLKDLNPVFDYYTPLVITNEKLIEASPEVLKKFMRALARGYEEGYASPETSAKVLLEYAPELNETLVVRSQAYLADEDRAAREEGRPYWGYQKESVWSGFSNWMHEAGLIDQPIDVKKAFTNDILPQK